MFKLNVKGLMKNRHLSKAIAEQNFNRFITIMRYKCEFNEIEFIQVPRFYPSSKRCSKCGEVKRNLKLSDRVFQCECGHEIDRDLNASINLANYRVS
ncbi:MAG: RNA-guided endonuclease InsQ/TnpB family protein [Fusobacteriaceae bacterium]